jgi:hypothetical protein
MTRATMAHHAEDGMTEGMADVPPAGGRWFRLNTTWSQSEWLAVLPPAARLAWIELLGHVKAHGFDGRVRAVSPVVFGRMVGLKASDIKTLLAAATADGALTCDDGHWIITGWREHQGDPTGKDRVQRFRDRAKTGRNGSNALPPLRNAYRDRDRDRDNTRDAIASQGAFDVFWADYPKRAGGNPKGRARNAWNARIRDGAVPDAIIQGRNRYIAHLRAEGKLGTRYVMQAATFLGPDKRWEDEWSAQTTLAPQSYDYSKAANGPQFTGRFTP